MDHKLTIDAKQTPSFRYSLDSFDVHKEGDDSFVYFRIWVLNDAIDAFLDVGVGKERFRFESNEIRADIKKHLEISDDSTFVHGFLVKQAVPKSFTQVPIRFWLLGKQKVTLLFSVDISKEALASTDSPSANFAQYDAKLRVQQLLKAKNFSECIQECQSYFDKWKYDLDVMLAMGDAYFFESKYSDALSIYYQIGVHVAFGKRYLGFFSKVRQALTCTMQAQENIVAAWLKFSSDSDARFGDALNKALQNHFSESQTIFSDAVDHISTRDDVRKILKDAYEMIILALTTESTSELPPESPKITKAFVSGMGWSGSGAIYDFLCEFDNVVPIKDETPYIEGNKSLKTIYDAINDDERLKEEMFNFFFYTLVGYGNFQQDNDFVLFYFARRKLFCQDPVKHLENVKVWTQFAAKVLNCEKEQRLFWFKKMATFVVNAFSINTEIPENKIALLDNVVHIHNVSCIEFLEDTHIYCCFRDPRSNYVSLLREFDSFHRDVNRYVSDRKVQIKSILKIAQEYAGKSLENQDSDSSVSIINFEDFVLSESCRDDIARALKLELSAREKFRQFKPWESMRNVVLHQEHSNQDEISYIEDELGEFCVEVCTRPLKSESC